MKAILAGTLLAATAVSAYLEPQGVKGPAPWKTMVKKPWTPSHDVEPPSWPSSVLPSGPILDPGVLPPVDKSLGLTNRPPVDSKALQKSVNITNLLAKAQHLQDIAYATPGRNRLIGSKGYNDTVAYLRDSIKALGDYYNVTTQAFVVPLYGQEASLTVHGKDQAAAYIEASPLTWDNITAPFAPVEDRGCHVSDYNSFLEGSIALIPAGGCSLSYKSAQAGRAGAMAAVIWSKDSLVGTNLQATMEDTELARYHVPTVGISYDHAMPIMDHLLANSSAKGDINGTLEVVPYEKNVTTFNVIAQTTGGNQSSTLVFGAHSDSGPSGPGINDNGSGTVALLEIAQQLTAYSTNNSIRFCWYVNTTQDSITIQSISSSAPGGEEEGLMGSTYYVDHLHDAEFWSTKLYLNFDMIASPNYMFGIYDGDKSISGEGGEPGSGDAEHFFQKVFEEKGLRWTPVEFDGRSDYGPFMDAEIAAGGLFTGAEQIKTQQGVRQYGGIAGVEYDKNYHGPGDNVTNLNTVAFEINAKVIAAAVAEYGASFASLDLRDY